MLYNTNWEADAKISPLTLEALAAWLEKRPALGRYNYEDCSGACLYGLYMASHGIAWHESGAASSRDSGPERAEFCALVYAEVACEKPWTFGAALKRTRAALAVQSSPQGSETHD